MEKRIVCLGWDLWEAGSFLVLCLLPTLVPQVLAPLEPASLLLVQPRSPGRSLWTEQSCHPHCPSPSSPDMNTEVHWKSVVHPLPSRTVTETAKEPRRSHAQCLPSPLGPTPACVPGPENWELVTRGQQGGGWTQTWPQRQETKEVRIWGPRPPEVRWLCDLQD